MNDTTSTAAKPTKQQIKAHTDLARSDADMRAQGYTQITICGHTTWTLSA